MKFAILKDLNLRQNIIKHFNIYFFKKILFKNQILSKKVRFGAFLQLTENLKQYKTKIKNRCIITGKSRSVLRRYRISRHELKRYLNKGLLSGIHKIK